MKNFYLLFPLSLLLLSNCSLSLSPEDSDIDATIEISTSNHSQGRDTVLPGGIGLKYWNGAYYWQEDMRFEDSTLYRLLPPDRSGLYNDPSHFWPERIVYYTVSPLCSGALLTSIQSAKNAIEAVSSLTFQYCTSIPSNVPGYIWFEPSSSNYSSVGMIGNGSEQIIGIADATSVGTVIHEIMHALGFIHEMSRMDRSDYLIINWNNIQPSAQHNFDTTASLPSLSIGTLDYNSIMMYNSRTNNPYLAVDINEPLFTKLDGSDVLADRDTLSSGDIAGLAAVYGPPFHRMESWLMEIVYEDYSGNYDYIEIAKEERVVFYADESCTQPAALLYPRKLYIERTISECQYGGSVQSIPSTYTVTVPAGVSSYVLDQYNYIEHYINGNLYHLYKKDYEIINSHVPGVLRSAF